MSEFASFGSWDKNYHIAALSTLGWKSAGNDFHLCKSILDSLLSIYWDDSLTFSREGTRTMTDLLPGICKRFQDSATHNIIWVWWHLYRMDLVMHEYTGLIKEKSFQAFTNLIDYLHRHQNWPKLLETEYLHFVDTHWASNWVISWFEKHCFEMLMCLDRTQPDSSPPNVWWVLLLILSRMKSIEQIIATTL